MMGLGGGGLGTIVEESSGGFGLGQSHSEFIDDDEEEEFGLQLPPPAHFIKQPHNMKLSEKIQRVSRLVVIA